MGEFTLYNREREDGEVYLEHRVELEYSGDTPRSHMEGWIQNGYGGRTIEQMGEDIPGFAMSEGGDEVEYSWELFIIERYGSEIPESMSVNYAIKQMEHVGDSMEEDFIGASPVDIYSTFYCDQPELPPEPFFDVVVDPNGELIFQHL